MEVLSVDGLEEIICGLKEKLEEKRAEYMKTLDAFLSADGLVKRQVEIALDRQNTEFFSIKDELEKFENMLATVTEFDEGADDE
jgi:hypothetical protein